MQQDRLSNAIGLCMRAGRLKSGDDTVVQTVRAGKASLVLLDVSASAQAEKKCMDMCLSHGVELIRVNGLGKAIGKPGRIIACVLDEGFKEMIKRAVPQGDAAVEPKESGTGV